LNNLDVHLVNNRSSTLQELRRRFGLIPEILVNEGVNEMMSIIFPPVYSRSQGSQPTSLSSTPPKSAWKSSRHSSPASVTELLTKPAWLQSEPSSPVPEKSTTPMAISPLLSQESFGEIINVEEVVPESRDNYEFILIEYGLDIPSAYFSEGGYFPTTSRPKPSVPSPFYKDAKPVNSRDIVLYFEKYNVSIY
jgi:hypothetical protein